MKKVKLNNGVEMPILRLGVFQVPDPQECENSVLAALQSGYRLIDTAAAYGNEEAVGKAIKKSGIEREELFITTKLWLLDAGYEKTKIAFEKSLKALVLDYLDLYLIHMPYGDIYGSWKAMEELYKAGKIRAIGVCNFHPDRLKDLILHHEIKPAINQIETHPLFQQTETHDFLNENNVQIESWGPFVQGKGDIFNNELLIKIAGVHQKTVPQVILRWLIQCDIVAIPKSVKKERIEENINVFDFELNELEMTAIAGLDKGQSILLNLRDPDTVQAMEDFAF